MYRYPALHNWESMATLGTCTVPYLYVMADDVPDSCGFSGLSSVPVRVTHYTFGRTTDNNRSGRVRNFQDTAVKFTHGHHSHFPTNHTAPASRMDCSPTPAMQQQQHMGCNVYEVALLYDTSCTVLWQSGPSSPSTALPHMDGVWSAALASRESTSEICSIMQGCCPPTSYDGSSAR